MLTDGRAKPRYTLPPVPGSHGRPTAYVFTASSIGCVANAWYRRVKVNWTPFVDYSASSRTSLICATASCKSALISAIHPPARHQRTLRDNGHAHGLVFHAVCLSPGFRQVLITPCTEGKLRLSRPGCHGSAHRAEVVYPSKDGHPPRH